MLPSFWKSISVVQSNDYSGCRTESVLQSRLMARRGCCALTKDVSQLVSLTRCLAIDLTIFQLCPGAVAERIYEYLPSTSENVREGMVKVDGFIIFKVHCRRLLFARKSFEPTLPSSWEGTHPKPTASPGQRGEYCAPAVPDSDSIPNSIRPSLPRRYAILPLQ